MIGKRRGDDGTPSYGDAMEDLKEAPDMTMIEKCTVAVIEKWHPGSMAASAAENGRMIVPPKTYDEARAAVLATFEAMKEPTEAQLGYLEAELNTDNLEICRIFYTGLIEAALAEPPSPQEGLRRSRK